VTSSTKTASIAIARSSTCPLTAHCTMTLRTTRSGLSRSRSSWTPSMTTSRPRSTIWTSRSWCRSKMSSPSPAVAPWWPAVSSVVSSRSTPTSRSSASVRPRPPPSPPSRPSTSRWTSARLATTPVCCSAASTVTRSSVARFWLLRAPWPRTPSSRAKSTCWPRTKAAVTRRSSPTTVRSSTSVPPTSPASSPCRKALRWCSRAITLPSALSWSSRSLWKRAWPSQCVKAATPSARAVSPRSSS
jgi:EF-Tu: translation elongation factor Tu